MSDTVISTTDTVVLRKKQLPRLGFLGVGWIGKNRMDAIAQSGLAEIAVLCDASPEILQNSLLSAPAAKGVASYDELLNADIDGIIIATPSAQHTQQSVCALKR